MATEPNKCWFVVTGFGPFHGVPQNPTMILVQRLAKETANLSSMNIDVLQTIVLETSAEAVKKEIDEIHKQICSQAINGHVVFLHLGVNYMGKKVQLEQCAYNDATFRVPDEVRHTADDTCVMFTESTGDITLEYGSL
jgi:pyroglutamyl-peptidase